MELLNIHDFIPQSRANGPGVRAVIWVQGCSRSCPGCFNPSAQEFIDRTLVAVSELKSKILAIEEIDGVTFSGGEPFEQAEQLARLAKKLREHELTVVCYTGYTLEQLKAGNREDWNNLLEHIDLLIDGPFIRSERCHEPYRGSANQRIHFLSDRIRIEEIKGNQMNELILNHDGRMHETGFPNPVDVAETFKEIKEILNFQ